HEPKRAAKFGLGHFSWLCINSKEAENVKLAKEVIDLIPKLLNRPNVLGIGEIGLNKNSRNELRVLEMQVELAAKHDQLILVHTPHLEDKLKGTRLILDVLKSDRRIRPERVIIDHVEEHTVEMVLDGGMWAGMTLYPETKCTPARAIDILEIYGHERLWLNSACDWGVSDPLAVPKTALEMRKRGHLAAAIENIVFENPKKFLGQCAKFKVLDVGQTRVRPTFAARLLVTTSPMCWFFYGYVPCVVIGKQLAKGRLGRRRHEAQHMFSWRQVW